MEPSRVNMVTVYIRYPDISPTDISPTDNSPTTPANHKCEIKYVPVSSIILPLVFRFLTKHFFCTSVLGVAWPILLPV